MISRSRSAPTAAAMSIECTTSANSTVTCLYSACSAAAETAAPHALQNFEFGGSSVLHAAQTKPVAVMARREYCSRAVMRIAHVDIVPSLAGRTRAISPLRSG